MFDTTSNYYSQTCQRDGSELPSNKAHVTHGSRCHAICLRNSPATLLRRRCATLRLLRKALGDVPHENGIAGRSREIDSREEPERNQRGKWCFGESTARTDEFIVVRPSVTHIVYSLVRRQVECFSNTIVHFIRLFWALG